jgi:hypothetical protein
MVTGSVAKIEVSWDDAFAGNFPESTAQQLFTQTVIATAAQAKAALPELNGKVDKARDLVLGGLVTRNADGTFTVKSQSERGKTYVINGSCTCPDAEKAPEGRCKHLISTFLWRKARKAIEAQLAEQESAEAKAPAPVAIPLPEAPASCNVYVTLAGRKIQMTLRDSDEQRLLARLEALLKRFPAEEEAEQEPPEGWCPIHHCQMKLYTKNHKSWWSHRLNTGAWCRGK